MTINEQINTGVSAIILSADTPESIVVPNWATVTLDLNGFTLSGNGADHTINNKGNLIIKDSSQNKTGVVRNDVLDRYAVHNDFGGTLTINGGRFVKTQRGYTIHNWGSAVIINDI